MTVIIGVEESFARAGLLLRESASWAVSPEALRRLCHAGAAALAPQRPGRLGTAARFADATGDWGLHFDAGKLNTPDVCAT